MAETLYDQFEALDPERMDALGAPEERKAGHRLYEAERFGGLTWVVAERHVKATCDRRQVEFAVKDGVLLGACACGGSLQAGACRHLYAWLFAICNLLDDQRYRVLFRNNKFRDHLQQVYWSAQGQTRNPQPPGAHPELRLYVDEGGHFSIRVSSSWHQKARRRGLDEKDPLYRLVTVCCRGTGAQEELIRYLTQTRKTVPLSLHLPQRSYTQLRWRSDPGYQLRNLLTLDASDRIGVSHPVHGPLEGATTGSPLIPLPPALALVPSAWELARMEGYRTVEGISEALVAAEPIPVDTFHAGPAHLVGEDRDRALAGWDLRTANGREGSVPLPARVVATLSHPPDDDSLIYRPLVFAEGHATALPGGFVLQTALRPFLRPLPSLRTAECRQAMWRLLDALFLEADDAAASAAQEAIFQQAHLLPAQHARIREYLTDLRGAVLHRRHYLLRIQDGAWYDVELPQRDLGFALAVGRRLLAGVPIENAPDPALRTTAGLVKDRLGALVEALSVRGIEVQLDQRPVRSARIDILLTQRPTHAVDWFELHPTVRIEGQRALPGDWTPILRGGAWETGDGLVVLAERDRDILLRLREMIRSASTDAAGAEAGRVRRLEILAWLELEADGVRLDLEPELRETLDRLRSFERIEQTPCPVNLQATLRDYQRKGYQWLAFLYRHRFGACLADDMGLGKTIQTIALLAGIRSGTVSPQRPGLDQRPHLVVVPASLVFNWHEELMRFCPDLRVACYTGSDRTLSFEAIDVVITTYGILARDEVPLGQVPFHVVIFDEAQALKNPRTVRAQAARALQAAFVICLTGTPLENHIGEYFALIDLALPGLLGPLPRLSQSGREAERDTAVQRSKPFVLRRTKSAILSELPPKVEQTIHLELSETQREAYTRIVEEVRATVHDAFAAQPGNRAGILALAALTRLRQICVSAALAGVEDADESPKIEFLVAQLRALQEEGHAALVFSQFTRCLDVVEQALQREGLDWSRLDGNTPSSRRKQLVQRFQSGEGPGVFLLSLKAGGTGLNLTRASYVFHVDPWWNPAVEVQAADRAHRIGQTSTVFTIRLIMRHTVEEKIEILHRRKRAVFRSVLEEGRPASDPATLTREDFDFLLGSPS